MTTQEHIKADAEAATNDHAKNLRTYDMEYARMIARLFGYKEGYIAGATTENDRAQVLVDALEAAYRLKDLWLYTGDVAPEHEGEAQALSEMASQIETALEQWKGKEEEPKEQLIPTAVYKQVGSSMMEHTKEETCGHCGNEPGKHYIGNQLYLCDECMETHTEDCY